MFLFPTSIDYLLCSPVNRRYHQSCARKLLSFHDAAIAVFGISATFLFIV